jgi:hypothetical protein
MTQALSFKTIISCKDLKEKLSAAYPASRTRSIPNFLDLWDLKELALMERQDKIEVPKSWLNSLDSALSNQNLFS